jgi:multidrug efflux pump subunit AcrA (membrane-fusion protein)
MKRITIIPVLAVLCLAASVRAQVGQPLTLVTAQGVTANSVTTTGRLQPVITARLSPRISGQLVELGTDAQGRPLDAGMLVTKGQVLFKIEDTTFANHAAAAEAALDSATAALNLTKDKTREERMIQFRTAISELELRINDKEKDYERYKRLVEVDKTLPEKRLEEATLDLNTLKTQLKGAQAKLEEAEHGATKTEIAVAEARVKEAEVAVKTAKDDLRDTVVRAPFDGLITRRMKSPGDYLANMPPTEVIEIVSLDQLEVEYRLPEAYFRQIEEGKTAVTLTSPLLTTPVEAKVTRIIREIDPLKGTFACRTAVSATERKELMPGAFVTAEIKLNKQGGEVIVPQRAVVTEAGSQVVFVAAQGTMKRVAVELGDKLTEGVLIKSGLKDGDQILVGPAELLKDGAKLPAYLTGEATAMKAPTSSEAKSQPASK